MKKLIAFTFLITSICSIKAQELKAYQVYDKKGEKVAFSKMIEDLSKYDVVLFGEYHDDAIIHWLQLKTEEALYQKIGERLVLGAEMFERDNQKAIDQYLSGEIGAKQLKDSARLWQNFHTDYKPLLDFAKNHELKFIATNIPRRYAKVVSHHGLDSLNGLSKEEKNFIAALPINVDMKTPGYTEMKKMFEKHDMDNGKVMNFISAQAAKDATMSESILENLKGRQLLLHFNGNYHSKEYGGIYWYLKKQKSGLKNLKVAVVTVAKSDEQHLPVPEDVVPTEFIIVVPNDMTKTYKSSFQ